jgi:hypothetical protein
MVQVGTYQYMLVQHGTCQYEISTLVQDSMYQYILVHAFNKTCGFQPTHEKSGEISKGCTAPMHWIQFDNGDIQN